MKKENMEKWSKLIRETTNERERELLIKYSVMMGEVLRLQNETFTPEELEIILNANNRLGDNVLEDEYDDLYDDLANLMGDGGYKDLIEYNETFIKAVKEA